MKIEPTKTNKSKLALALRRRFGSPAAVLRALGLDENLVGTAGKPAGEPDDVDGSEQRLADFKVDLQQWLYGRRHGLPDGVTARLLAALEDLGGEDEGGEEAFRAFMRSKLSPEDLERAVELCRSGGDGEDRLPVSGPGGMHGYRSDRARGPGEKVFATDERKVAQADELERMFGTRRIGIGLDYGGRERARAVSPLGPSEAAVAGFTKMFPDAARLEK